MSLIHMYICALLTLLNTLFLFFFLQFSIFISDNVIIPKLQNGSLWNNTLDSFIKKINNVPFIFQHIWVEWLVRRISCPPLICIMGRCRTLVHCLFTSRTASNKDVFWQTVEAMEITMLLVALLWVAWPLSLGDFRRHVSIHSHYAKSLHQNKSTSNTVHGYQCLT